MAEVFKARQSGAEGFSRLVALKRIAPGLSHDAEFARMFIAEARIAAHLQHANVVAIHDFDRDEQGCLFLAMELVDGADLRRLLGLAREHGERPAPELAAWSPRCFVRSPTRTISWTTASRSASCIAMCRRTTC